MAKCSAITRKGEQCRGLVPLGSEYCAAHDPARADARRRAASIAGRSKPGSEIHEVKRQLRKLADDCLSGRVPSGVASITSQILGVWLKATEVEIKERDVAVRETELAQIKIPEFTQLQNEVQELRELLEEKESRRGRAWGG